MRHPSRLWFGLFLAGTLLETLALHGQRREATLSHLTRKTLRTHTPSGRIVFAAGWVWFAAHILKTQENS